MKLKELFRKRKRHNCTPLFILILLSPYFVGFTETDSGYTDIKFGAGGGQYVYQDCSGSHTQKFGDAGAAVVRKFEGPYRIGVSAGGWDAGKRGSYAIAYPDLALDWEYFSIGTTGIRLGSLKQMYVEAKGLDEPPYFSGKGFIRLGFGGVLEKPFSNFWIGTNGVPYNSLGLAAQIEFPFAENNFVFLTGRLGNDQKSGFSEYGVSVGLRIRYY